MNRAVTSKEEILAVCCSIVSREGIQAVNMRHVAEKCQVALGSLYHYFSSKDEMLLETVRSVWLDIFPPGQAFSSVADCIAWLYQRAARGKQKYPGFSLVHSMSFADSVRPEARRAMGEAFGGLRGMLLAAMERDSSIGRNAFTESYTREDFAELILSVFLSAQIRGTENLETLQETVRRSICG